MHLVSRGCPEREGWAAGSVRLIAGASTHQHVIRRRTSDLPSSHWSLHHAIIVAVWSFGVSVN